jgi:hypothetical protein
MEGLAAVQSEAPKVPERKAKQTEEEKIEAAREAVRLAVAELHTAVKVALRFDVPGWDLGAYLCAKIDPVLAEVGKKTAKLTKGRS